jgi:PIN domain nuclease of toxin-antitoxin system
MNIRPIYVCDTNAIYWHLTGDKRLTDPARQVFAAARRAETQIVLSAISVAELYYANRKWQLAPDFSQMYQDLVGRPEFQIAPFEHEAVLDFDRNQSVPEMHDRIITGLARHLNVPLITADRVITAARLVEIVW